ncbi:MAG: response regulator transcription factor [Bacteroidales bacterium]|nr:response regulator transcription factor [Bacteroidales bacterium]
MIILADNQALTRAGFAHHLGVAQWRVAYNKAMLSPLLASESATAVILDYALFDFEGIENLLIFVRRFPGVRWLLTSAEFNTDLLRLLSGEANVSFVTKDADDGEVRDAVGAILNGGRYVCSAVRDQLAARRETVATGTLTATETEVLRLIAQGKTSREIAEIRHSSVHTIITHKKNIFRKLEVSTAYEATRYAIRAGLVNLVEYYI